MSIINSQTTLEEAIEAVVPRRPTDPLPGTEQPHQFEQSVQSQYLDDQGREIPNPLPLAPPIGYKRQPTIAETMRAMIQQASYEASRAGAETEEEANDFDVGEDMDPHTPYEHDFEPDPALDAMLALQSAPPAPQQTQSVAPDKVPHSSFTSVDSPAKGQS